MVTVTSGTTATPSLAARIQALGDGNRLRILEALREGEMCVCVLVESLGLPQPLLSHHLRVLRDTGLVSGRKDGRWVHYSLLPEALSEIEVFLADLRRDAQTATGGGSRCS